VNNYVKRIATLFFPFFHFICNVTLTTCLIQDVTAVLREIILTLAHFHRMAQLLISLKTNNARFSDTLNQSGLYSLYQLNHRQIKSMIQLPNKEISGGTLHLSVPLVQRKSRDKRCDGQIVMVLTFSGMVNSAARAIIRSTSNHSSHLGIARVTGAGFYLYYMIVVELSR